MEDSGVRDEEKEKMRRERYSQAVVIYTLHNLHLMLVKPNS